MILRWPHLHGIGRSRLSSLLVGQEISVHNFFCQDVDPLWVKIAIKYFKWGQYWRGWDKKLAWKGTVGQLLWVEGPGGGERKKEKQHSDTLLSAGVLQDGESQGQAIDVILYRMLCSGPPPDQP